MSTIRILEWRSVPRNTLLGFCKVEFPSGTIIVDVSILNGPNGPWASPPSKPMLTREGIAMKDAAGKIRYVPIIEFLRRCTLSIPRRSNECPHRD